MIASDFKYLSTGHFHQRVVNGHVGSYFEESAVVLLKFLDWDATEEFSPVRLEVGEILLVGPKWGGRFDIGWIVFGTAQFERVIGPEAMVVRIDNAHVGALIVSIEYFEHIFAYKFVIAI